MKLDQPIAYDHIFFMAHVERWTHHQFRLLWSPKKMWLNQPANSSGVFFWGVGKIGMRNICRPSLSHLKPLSELSHFNINQYGLEMCGIYQNHMIPKPNTFQVPTKLEKDNTSMHFPHQLKSMVFLSFQHRITHRTSAVGHIGMGKTWKKLGGSKIPQ